MKIALLSAAYPPDLDGIGDYTSLMASALAERDDIEKPVQVFTRSGKHTPASGVEAIPFYDPTNPASFAHLQSAICNLKSQIIPDWLVLQYNPFSWGRRGFCPSVPRTLAAAKRMADPPKIAVMLHETTVPRWPWRFSLMYAWQRPVFRSLCRTADRLFVSTERWLPEVASTGTTSRATHLPVGSNIPRSSLSRGEARARLGIPADTLVAGVFGSAHLSRRLEWIGAAARELTKAPGKVLVLHVGPDGDRIRAACTGVNFRSEGVLPANAAADGLRAMDCVLSPFADGVSTRRGSVMAALQNGVPVATTTRSWTDGIFSEVAGREMLLSDVNTAEAFAREVADWVMTRNAAGRESVETFYDRHFSWPVLADRIAGVLDGEIHKGGAEKSWQFSVGS